MKKLVSIIVPVYNTEKYLKECLNSIVRQSYKEIEIILINDGSEDKSGKICDEFANKDSRIRVFHKKNEGVSAARNVGLKKSKGEYIYFADSDDILKEELIFKLVELMEKSFSDIAMCSYYYFQNFENKFFSSKEIPDGKYNKNEFVKIMLDYECYAGYLWNKLFKKELLKEIFFKKELKICEDAVFCIEYSKKISSGIITKEALYGYRDNPFGAMKQGFSENMLSNVLSLDYIIDYLIEEKYDDILIEKKCQELIFLCSTYYWHILFLRISNKKYWLKVMKNIFNKYYDKKFIWKNWNLKQKIIILMMKIRCF